MTFDKLNELNAIKDAIQKMTEEERQNYCKGCARSIYSEDPIGHSCDTNIEDNSYYNHANYPCYTRVNNKEEKEDERIYKLQ